MVNTSLKEFICTEISRCTFYFFGAIWACTWFKWIVYLVSDFHWCGENFYHLWYLIPNKMILNVRGVFQLFTFHYCWDPFLFLGTCLLDNVDSKYYLYSEPKCMVCWKLLHTFWFVNDCKKCYKVFPPLSHIHRFPSGK